MENVFDGSANSTGDDGKGVSGVAATPIVQLEIL